MENVTIRDLRNHGGDIIARVLHGERLIVTRDGEPVAELRPLPRKPLTARAFVERSRGLPDIDPIKFREDIDSIFDTSI